MIATIMPGGIFPHATAELVAARKKPPHWIDEAFTHFSERVLADDALPVKARQLIASVAKETNDE